MQCAESDSDSIAASVGEVLAVSELLPSLSLSALAGRLIEQMLLA